MVFSRLLANDSVVGVDIGSASIKIMRADYSRKGARISNVAMCPTPPGSVKEGVVIDIPEVAAAVQFALRTAGIRASDAVAAIAGPGVIVRHARMPKVTEQVLRKSLHFEASKYISASMEDSVVEFEILGDAEEEDRMNVMLVAAPKAMINSKMAVLEQAGLDPLAIDVEAFAIFRALIEHSADPTLREHTIALMDIGASHTEINLVSKGSLALTRTIPIAGVSITNALKNAENCTEVEAEQRKFELDLSELLDAPNETATSPSLKVVQSLIDELLREIRRSMNFYQSQLPEGAADAAIDRLILTGGVSRLKGFVPYANRRLNIEVGIGDPSLVDLASCSSPDSQLSQEDIPLFTVAYGLAVKESPVPVQASPAAVGTGTA